MMVIIHNEEKNKNILMSFRFCIKEGNMKKIIILFIAFLLLFSLIPVRENIEPVAAPTNNTVVPVVRTVETVNKTEEIKGIKVEEEIKSIEIEEIEKNIEITTTSDLRILSNLSAEEFNKMLENTELFGLGDALVRVEKEIGINGLYMVGLACLESGYGKSNLARNKNNLVGWNAVDSNPNNATYFSSKEECILFVAGKLKKNYLTENGIYFNGFSADAINIKYSSDQQHAEKIISIVNKLIKKI